MAAQSTSATNAELVKIKYEKRFLEFVRQELQLAKASQSNNYRILPGEGKTIEWTQYLPKALVTTALTEGTTPSVGSFTTQIKRATLEQWGHYDEYSDFLEYTSLDPRVMGLMELQGTQASESIELESEKIWATTCGIPLRADLVATHQFQNVAVTTATSSTAFSASALNQATNFWVGAKVTITEGPGYGEARIVATHTGTGGALTFGTAWDTTPTTASKFAIAVPGNAAAGDDLAAGDIISPTNTKRALKELRIALAKPIKGGFYMGILDPYTEQDMMGDTTTWQALNIQHISGSQAMFDGEVGKLWGISFVRGTLPFRSAVATGGTYSATGLVHHVPILGKNSFGVVNGEQQEVILTPAKIYDPALQLKSTIGWKVMWKAKALNACWSVDLMCGSA